MTANFKTSFSKTLGEEGGYSNDPNDAGGETFCGISRVFNPNWIGWKRVDEIKAHGEFPKADDTLLMIYVQDFYRANIWDKIRGDAIQSQRIADVFFDTATNFSVVTAIRMVQDCLDLLVKDMTVDGKIGTQTITTLNQLGELEDDFIELLISRRHAHRWNSFKKQPANKAFMKGWILNRDNGL